VREHLEVLANRVVQREQSRSRVRAPFSRLHSENVFDLDNVRLRRYAGGARAHRIEELALSAFGHALAVRGMIDAQKPFTLQAHFAAVRPVEPAAQVAGTLSGNLLEIALDAHASAAAGGTATAQATIRPEDEQPLAAIKLQAQDIDPRAFEPSLPQAVLSAEIALTRQDGRLQGPLVVRNATPGPIDRGRIPLAALQAELGTNLSTVGFSALRADLGAAGSVTGSGTVQGEEALLELAIKGLDLRGVYSTLRQTQLAGKVEMRLTPAEQSVQAELAQDDIRLALQAERNGDDVRIPSFRAQARGGVAEGQAQINLAGQRPFSLQAELKRFDPSAWGDFPGCFFPGSRTAFLTIFNSDARSTRVCFDTNP
jgi:autotransporter translocation and assembly factor TamB